MYAVRERVCMGGWDDAKGKEWVEVADNVVGEADGEAGSEAAV